MLRRSFLTLGPAAISTAGLTLAHPIPCPAAQPRPRCRGTLLLLTPPAGWQPRSWRDVPPPPFTITRTVAAGGSLAACRALAKAYNRKQLDSPATWLLVAATDGRLAEGGAV